MRNLCSVNRMKSFVMIGTINLDYRSLVHHFENGVWMYQCDSIKDLKTDIEETMARSMCRKPPTVTCI